MDPCICYRSCVFCHGGPEQDCLPTCCGTASAWAKERSAHDHDKKDDKDEDTAAAH